MLPTPTDARADWTCNAGASLIVQANGPEPGAFPRLHAVVYTCEAHRADAEARIIAAGYRPNAEAAPPGHQWDPWPCGHITAYEAAAAPALTAEAAPADVEEFVTWVVYRPRSSDSDVGVEAGIEGEARLLDPESLAREMLEAHAAGRPGWYVNVYGEGDQLLAWADWEGEGGAPRSSATAGTE